MTLAALDDILGKQVAGCKSQAKVLLCEDEGTRTRFESNGTNRSAIASADVT